MKLALGTAQIGLDYGVANRHGQLSFEEATAIVRLARASGMDTLDTALGYGSSEQRLGKIGVGDWKVVSKLPAMPAECADVTGHVEGSLRTSLSHLGIRRLYGLLLHRPQQLLERDGDRLYSVLQRVKEDGLVQKVGVSIYDPVELDTLCSRFRLDLVQAPFNLLDRRLIDSGWMARLQANDIELHVRSAFLQGLLLMEPHGRPKKFDRWAALWKRYDEWLGQSGLTPLQACLRYVLSFAEIGKVVVGVDSRDQLIEILEAADGPAPSVPEAIAAAEPELINPARWHALA